MRILRCSLIVAGLLVGVSLAALMGQVVLGSISGQVPCTVRTAFQNSTVQTPNLKAVLGRFYGAVSPAVASLPLTQLKLLGVYLGEDRVAFLKGDQGTLVVRAGQKIGPWRIERIEKDRVVLRSGQRTAILSLFEGVTARPFAKKAGNRMVLQRSDIQRFTADPGQLLRQVRLVPHVQNGYTEGFRFEYLDPESLFCKAGVQPGDVLLALNNIRIKSTEDAFRILEVLRNESLVTVALKRGGQLINIEVEIR